MLIIPAIDLKEGQVVRYRKGRMNKKVYSCDPVGVALGWQNQGAKLLHIVDLDGAMTGEQVNFPIIARIIKSLSIPVEVSGGIRDFRTMKKIIDKGAERIVIGTKAIEDSIFLKDAIKKFGKKICMGLDSSGGNKIGVDGWRRSIRINIKPLLMSLDRVHLKTIIFTDIKRDGTLEGMDIARVRNILNATNIDVIVSGGVSALSDVKKLVRLDRANLKGVIIGKALYENVFSLSEAIKCGQD